MIKKKLTRLMLGETSSPFSISVSISKCISILRGNRNLSFGLRRSLLRTFETIWILVITLEFSNITASKSIRREGKMGPMELSGVNFSTHGSE